MIGGKQLLWPPVDISDGCNSEGEPEDPSKQKEEKKEVHELTKQVASLAVEESKQASAESQSQSQKDKHVQDMFKTEMGFSYVVKKLIEVQKQKPIALVGHNMMYDVIYFYNQFIGALPETYADFVKLWHACFPLTLDTKVLACRSDVFSKTVLGTMFEKCQRDKKFMNLLHFRFDLENGFSNYEGSNLLSHYHEAAYDAYMTGYCYAMILKFMEIDELYK